MAEKKVSMRMCAGCGARKPKNELIRVVRTPDGEICLDATGKKNGRGTYICQDAGCLNKAIRARRFENAFSMQIPPEIYERLQKELNAVE